MPAAMPPWTRHSRRPSQPRPLPTRRQRPCRLASVTRHTPSLMPTAQSGAGTLPGKASTRFPCRVPHGFVVHRSSTLRPRRPSVGGRPRVPPLSLPRPRHGVPRWHDAADHRGDVATPRPRCPRSAAQLTGTTPRLIRQIIQGLPQLVCGPILFDGVDGRLVCGQATGTTVLGQERSAAHAASIRRTRVFRRALGRQGGPGGRDRTCRRCDRRTA